MIGAATRVTAALLSVAVVGSVAGCFPVPTDSSTPPPSDLTSAGTTTPPVTGDVVLMDFDDGRPDHLLVEGSAQATARVISAGGGKVELVARDGYGRALRLPARDGHGVAVVAVYSESEGALAPVERDFAFGADVMVDPGHDDDGENLMQRGLSGDVGQYKLQIDGGVPSCVVKGSEGRVYVELAEQPVAAQTWYRLSCRRSGDEVELEVERLDTGQITTASQTGQIGAVRTEIATAPLTIGGKLTGSGRLADGTTDQFHGVVDNVWLHIGNQAG